jgi:hypothetical protein
MYERCATREESGPVFRQNVVEKIRYNGRIISTRHAAPAALQQKSALLTCARNCLVCIFYRTLRTPCVLGNLCVTSVPVVACCPRQANTKPLPSMTTAQALTAVHMAAHM